MILGKGNAPRAGNPYRLCGERGQIIFATTYRVESPASGCTVTTPTTVNFGVLPQAFKEAINADVTASSQWTTLRDAVTVCTGQLHMHGYYPEIALVAIKTAVRYAAGRLLSPEVTDEVVSIAAQFCIAAYFDPSQDTRETAVELPGVAIPRGLMTPGSSELRSSQANGV